LARIADASQQTLIRGEAPKAEDLIYKAVRKDSPTEVLGRMVNHAKSRVRARLEHVFCVVVRLWGVDKARRRGLAIQNRG
jgi:IS5 family transposase